MDYAHDIEGFYDIAWIDTESQLFQIRPLFVSGVDRPFKQGKPPRALG